MKLENLKALATTIHRGQGDALAGEAIIAQARRVGKAYVVPGSSTHQMQQLVLKSNVLCVIDRPFKTTSGAFRIKKA